MNEKKDIKKETFEVSWIEKYRPKKISEIRGQNQAIDKIKVFLKNFPNKRAAILYGPPGTGKTSIVYALANELNSEILELNASDLRSEERLISVLKPAIEQKSLTKESKIILIDEVDGISKEDENCISQIIKICGSSFYPIFLTANDIWDRKFVEIRNVADIVPFKEIDYKTAKEFLVDILKKEKKFLDNDIITNIVIKSKGDLRAAINDLQVAAILEEPSKFLIHERNKEIDIFSALRIILKGKPQLEFLRLFDSVDKNLDEIFLWIEENIPLEYKDKELLRAYEILSRVDIFRRRINRQQYWRFLVYQNDLLSYGISSAKESEKFGFTSYKKPTRVLKMWLNNQKTEIKKSIIQKYARYIHVSEKKAMQEFPIIKKILLKQEIQKELGLTEGEIAYLKEN
ncbi:MAG: replication protein C [Candidatus Pacearchaeota archaeon]|nr:MAG: replication protein C [Candidatus Pacearchaeota archaeon]